MLFSIKAIMSSSPQQLAGGELLQADWDRVIIATVWIFLIQAALL
jgi:hypothetical protein